MALYTFTCPECGDSYVGRKFKEWTPRVCLNCLRDGVRSYYNESPN